MNHTGRPSELPGQWSNNTQSRQSGNTRRTSAIRNFWSSRPSACATTMRRTALSGHVILTSASPLACLLGPPRQACGTACRRGCHVTVRSCIRGYGFMCCSTSKSPASAMNRAKFRSFVAPSGSMMMSPAICAVSFSSTPRSARTSAMVTFLACAQCGGPTPTSWGHQKVCSYDYGKDEVRPSHNMVVIL